jgi:peptidoglycan/xylan/chitin deacetylase (PgdA/CDA1 family)
MKPLKSLSRSFLAGLVLLCIGIGIAAGHGREVAITIDDLPRGGDGGPYDQATVRVMTGKLLRPFREQAIPVTGFVNAGRHATSAAGLRELLDLWLDAGADLGNHSWSHLDINSVPLATYTDDILKGEPALREALGARGKALSFYRHPYLHAGNTTEAKAGLQAFLDQHGYRVAPVTLDDGDYEYAAAYTKPRFRARVRREYIPYMESVVAFFEARSVEVTGHEVSQILLIHANQLNADLMPQLLDMFRRRGYRFVTLEQALQDPAYQLPENYVGPGGFSWIHRWSLSKGMPAKAEPDPADWVQRAFAGN